MRTSEPRTVSAARCAAFACFLTKCLKSNIQTTLETLLIKKKLTDSLEPLTASVLIADVRKPPNISQVHRKSNDRQEKIHLLAPFVPGVRLRDGRHRDGVVGAEVGVRGAVVDQTVGHDC